MDRKNASSVVLMGFMGCWRFLKAAVSVCRKAFTQVSSMLRYAVLLQACRF